MASPRKDKTVRSALATGRKLAAQAVERRDAALRRRQRNLRRAQVPAAGAVPPGVVRALRGRQSLGTLVAEGDSWFAYPGRDVLSALHELGFDIVEVANAGDTIEDMAYGHRQLDDFLAALDRILESGIMPKAILLSAGGNDVAGDVFAMIVNHRLAATRGLNASVLKGVVDERIYNAYVTIIAKVTEVCVLRVPGARIPIILHGYAPPVPDGRGFLGGGLFLPGPWLEPGFRVKGFNKQRPEQFDEMKRMAKRLIDQFNDMVASVANLSDFRSHVHYLNLRDVLSNGADYKSWWANELHPTDKGFTAIAEEYAKLIARV